MDIGLDIVTSDWAGGYVTGIGYSYGYYPELAPSFLQYVLLARGYQPPAPRGTFRYCELGFGQGVCVNLLAAANPRGEFWGTDFLPEHAVFAQSLAREGKTGATLLADDFGTFANRDIPEFDFITLHGVWSWVNPEAKAQILEAVRRRLKPGGILYLSYNVLPGWTVEVPLRDLMKLHIDLETPNGAPDDERIGRALTFANDLARGGASYFANTPGVERALKDHSQASKGYLAHEYFNDTWSMTYFASLAQTLGSARVSFAASAHQSDLIDLISERGSLPRLLDGISSRVLRETATDFVFNRRFRRDIFTLGARRLTNEERADQMSEVRFALLSGGAELAPSQASAPNGSITLDARTHQPLAEVLNARGNLATFAEIASDERLSHLSRDDIDKAMRVLVAMRLVHPVFGDDTVMAPASRARQFNDAVVRRSRYDNHLRYLASPVSTSGIETNRFTRLLLGAWLEGQAGPDELAERAWQRLARADRAAMRLPDGSVLHEGEQGLNEFKRRAAEFVAVELPQLQLLGVA